MVVLFGILKKTFRNKRLLVKFVAVAGYLEAMVYAP